MNPEVRTTLLNTYSPKFIATILKALRERLQENGQLKGVYNPVRDPVRRNLERWRRILGCLVLAARREEIA